MPRDNYPCLPAERLDEIGSQLEATKAELRTLAWELHKAYGLGRAMRLAVKSQHLDADLQAHLADVLLIVRASDGSPPVDAARLDEARDSVSASRRKPRRR